MSDGTEIATIEQAMRERPGEYFRDEGMQERYRGLLDARESGGAAVPAQSRNRIAEIEAIMKTDRRGYFKNEALQAEYRALLQAAHPDSEATAPAAAHPVTPAVRAAAPAAGSAEMREVFGDHELDALARAGGKVNAIFSALGGSAPADLEMIFRTLPPAVRSGIIGEMGRHEAGYVNPATPDEIAGIRAMPGMAELLSHWGQAGPRKLAVALEAYNRFRAGLSADDRRQFVGFWRHLPARQKVLTLWALGGA